MGRPLRAAWMILIGSQFLAVWISSYVIVLLLIILISGWKQLNWQELKQNTLFKAIFLLFAWQVLSLIWTTNMKDAGANLATQLLLVLLPAFLFIRKPNSSDLRWLFKAQLFSTLFAILFAYGYAVWRVTEAPVVDHTIYNAYFFYTGLSAPIMHPGYFSLHIIASLGILIHFWIAKYWRINLTTIVLAAVLLGCLIMLNGRMTILSGLITAALALIYLAVSKKQWKPMIALVGLTLVLAIGTQFLPKQFKQRLFEFTESFNYDISSYQANDYNGITIRLAEWECANEVIRENFWIGTGAGDGKDALNQVYVDKGFQVALIGQYNSHNQFVEAMLYGGFIQMLLLLTVFFLGLRRGILTKNYLLTAFLVFVFFCLQTETVLFWHRGVLFFAIFLGLFSLAVPVLKTKKA